MFEHRNSINISSLFMVFVYFSGCLSIKFKVPATGGLLGEDEILRIRKIQISFEKTSESEELTSNTM